MPKLKKLTDFKLGVVKKIDTNEKHSFFLPKEHEAFFTYKTDQCCFLRTKLISVVFPHTILSETVST